MIKYLFLFLFICINSSVAYGQLKEATQNPIPQDATTKEKKVAFNTPAAAAKAKAKKMKTSLKLNDIQETSIYDIFLKYENDTDKVQKSKLTKKEKFTKMNKLSRDRQKQMEKILTKDQYHNYIMSFP